MSANGHSSFSSRMEMFQLDSERRVYPRRYIFPKPTGLCIFPATPSKMLLAVLIANSEGNILVERFNGVPAEERLHWRSFLVKLGADNLKGVKNEELLVASHKSVYIVYTVLGDVSIYVVGKDDYDELALAEAIFVVTSAVKDVCGKVPTERLFLDKYGKICLCLDEIVWKGLLENTDKDRIKRLIRLKPPTDF